MFVWLYVGKKFIKKKPDLVFWFLSTYIFFSTHSCMMEIEDRKYRPDFNFNSVNFFEQIEAKKYQFEVVDYQGNEYVKVRPWSDNLVIFTSYNLYRLFLLHSYIPEYVFDFKGKLVDWTGDSNDDPRYQDSWGRAKKIRVISMQEYLKIINTYSDKSFNAN